MKKMKRMLVLLLALAMLLSMAACKRNGDPQATEPAGPQAPAVTYTVKVQTAGGMALSDVGVYIYEDETMGELVWFDQTGEDGAMTFTDVPRDTYVAVLSEVPTGYAAEAFYPITGETTTIVLEVGTLDADNVGDMTYKLGDMMMDFSVIGPDGTEYKLSELLQQKKAVMLNFWYIGCEPCKAEFPYLQEAYDLYSQDMAVLAMNHIDSEEAIAAFQQENGYTFPMVSCDPVWQQLMKLTAYPTTVIVDRYGNICLLHKGTIDNAKTFKDIFGYFTAEDYEAKVIDDLTTILTEEEAGTKDNPQDLSGQTNFQVEVEPGAEVYTSLHKAKGMYLSIRGKGQDFYVLYNDKTYTPDSSGTVGFVVSTGDNYTAAVFGIGNTGTEKQSFTVSLSHLPGTFNNPYSLKVGEFTATVSAGNSQGVYYRGTAPEDGTFTIQCISAPSGVKYDFSLQSMDVNWTVLRNYSGDGVVDEESGYPTVTMQMKKGMDVMFAVGTLPDDSNSYPGGTFKFLLSFEAGEVQGAEKVEMMDYTITVTDEAGQPVAGVTVWLTKDEQTVSAKTDETGLLTLKLEKGTYTGTIGVPEGYTLENNAFTLTEEAPSVTLQLATAVDTRIEYTVTVYDPDWTPAPGVEVVILGAGSTTTNEEGLAVFKLEPGNYTVLTGAMPNGWECSEVVTLTATQTTGELYLSYMLGMKQNPIVLQELNNTVTNTGTIYYSAQFNGATMDVTGEGQFHVLLDDQVLNPVDGVVSQKIVAENPRMPVVFAIVGDGEFTVDFTYPAGHQMNPAPLEMGLNTATQAAGASDYYYQWTAPGTGELTISLESAQWVYSISNLTTGVTSDTHWSDDDPAVPGELLTVTEGEEILLIVNTYDPGNMFQNPAGDVAVRAAFVWTLDCENFTTAPVQAASNWNYRLAGPEGATLTIENANAYVIYGNTTYGPDSEGKVVVALGHEDAAELIIGNMGADAESFEVSFSWPTGSARNPQVLKFRFPQTPVLNLEAGDTDGYYYNLTSTLAGTVTFERVSTGADASGYTIVLNRNNGEEICVPAPEDDTKKMDVYVFPDDVLQIHVQAVADGEGNYPAVSNIRTKITFVQDYTTYVVSFDANGGALTDNSTAETTNGKISAMPTDPVRADHIFLGWFDALEGGKQITSTTSIKSDMTVYARWEKIEYNVTFDPRGGAMEGETVLRTTDYCVTALPEATMEGYTFLGWFDLPAGGNAITTETVFGDHTTVYAQWKSEYTGGDTGEMLTYQVKVIDDKGQNVTSGVYVTWQSADRMETRIINNADGSVSASLPANQYTVMLTMTGAYAGYCYDAASAITTAENRDVTIRIAKPLGSDAVQTDYESLITLDVPMGATYVKLNASQVNYAIYEGVAYCYFRYAVTEEGKYAVAVTNGAALTNWGFNSYYIHDQSTAEERDANTFTVEIKQSNIPEDTGVLHLFMAVEVTEEFADTVLIISDAGDAEWSIEDEPYVEYEGTQIPEVAFDEESGKAVAIEANIFKLNPGSKTLTYVDMLKDKPVKGDDGFYHLGSKTGPVLYVNLGENAPYISLGILTGAIGQYGTGFRKTFINPDGTYEKNPDGTYRREDYTDGIIAYVLHADVETGVYPLTDDLIYMIQNGGEYLKWYDPESDTYLFKDKNIEVDLSLAWMFAVCYLK